MADPYSPKLTGEEQRLYDQYTVQTVAAGPTAVAGGLAWLGAVGQRVQQVLAHVNTANTKNASGEGNRRQIT